MSNKRRLLTIPRKTAHGHTYSKVHSQYGVDFDYYVQKMKETHLLCLLVHVVIFVCLFFKFPPASASLVLGLLIWMIMYS
jgi:hypothetical protein